MYISLLTHLLNILMHVGIVGIQSIKKITSKSFSNVNNEIIMKYLQCIFILRFNSFTLLLNFEIRK